MKSKEQSWEKEFDEKFFIEPNPGQNKHCDLCGHDHTETGDNEGYGEGLKAFIRSTIQAEKEALLKTMLKDFTEAREREADPTTPRYGSAGAGLTLAVAVKYIEGKLSELGQEEK